MMINKYIPQNGHFYSLVQDSDAKIIIIISSQPKLFIQQPSLFYDIEFCNETKESKKICCDMIVFIKQVSFFT